MLSSKGAATAVEAEPAEKRSIRTKKKIEAAIAEEVGHFEQEYMGQVPGKVLVYLMGDLLVVRFPGGLAEIKQPLAELLPAERQQEVLKDLRALQRHLIETTRPVIEAIVEKITAVKVLTTQHEIDADTGEKVFFFTLARSPDLLE